MAVVHRSDSADIFYRRAYGQAKSPAFAGGFSAEAVADVALEQRKPAWSIWTAAVDCRAAAVAESAKQDCAGRIFFLPHPASSRALFATSKSP